MTSSSTMGRMTNVILWRSLGIGLLFLGVGGAEVSEARSAARKGGRTVRVAAHSSPRRPTATRRRARRPSSNRDGWQLLTGMNFSYAKAVPESGGSTRNAPAIHLLRDFSLSRQWYLASGLSLVSRGVQTNLYELEGLNLTGTVQLDYLEIPFYWGWRASPAGGFHFLTGPSFALAMRRQIAVLDLVSLDLSQRFLPYDLKWDVGLGWSHRLSTHWNILVQVRYSIGLIDIDQTEESYHTRGIQTLLGVRFGF